jgi:hypothetical protein
VVLAPHARADLGASADDAGIIMDHDGPASRWGHSFADPSGAAFAEIVSADVVLEGSVFALPIRGRQAVWATLRAAAGIYDALTLTADAEGDGRAYLDWTATALGWRIAGVTVLYVDQSGRFARIALHHRPLGAVMAFSAELGRRLAGQISADHFYPQ